MIAMDPKRLWAKSHWGDEIAHPSKFLPGHLADVYAAGTHVLDATGDEQLLALGLNPNDYRERLQRCVLLAAAVHDLGKANDHFQGMICRTRDVRTNPQGLRHEWVSILILQQMREWLLPTVKGSATDFAIVEWAVAGHHPAQDHASPPRLCPPGAGIEIEMPLGHSDIAAILDWLQSTLQLDPFPKLADQTRNLVAKDNVFAGFVAWSKTARRIWDGLNFTDRRFVAAVKSCLIAADIAGSALPPKSAGWCWITDSFAQKPQPGELQSIVDQRLNGNLPREFQSTLAASRAPVTFVKAGCGSGKTLGAYLWAAKNHPTRRLYFCYPTTGTATEGFKDYLLEPDVKADLFHSRREIDFEILLKTGADAQHAEADAAIRIDSLDAWSTPIVACTVDTVLGIVQNNKRGLFAWPAIAQSAFVFDEIHAFDDRLFGALLRFLRDLPGLPVLLMTASLPLAREETLREILQKYRHMELNPIAGPAELEELPRYKKAMVADNDPLPLIEDTIRQNGKVLWVCNTVGHVMEAADRAKAAGLKPLIYHSRFKYVDRVQRHSAVIEAFKHVGPALAICSQVAEMSLDLSADLLVSDLAPVPALIQRLGRLNRRAMPGSGDDPKPFVVVESEQHLPYTPADLISARAWLAKLSEEQISQRDLADLWEQTADNPPDLVPSAWLDGGPITTVSELREASPGITVLMREDVSRIMKPKDVGRYSLPMPPPGKRDWQAWSKHNGIPIAEPGTITYDQERGAKWTT